MPLFRKNRALLDEALQTTIVVKDMQSLKDAIRQDWEMWLGHQGADHTNFKCFDVKVEIPYNLPLESSFDPRCGWYTHYVCADIMCKGEFYTVGFLSEPLDD